jgi:hypothetical protein
VLTTAEHANDALSTYTYDAENGVATRDGELSGGFAGADEVEGAGHRRGLGMGADGAPMFEKLLYALTCARLLQNRSLALFGSQWAFPTLMFDELDICPRFPAAFDGALPTARRSTKQRLRWRGISSSATRPRFHPNRAARRSPPFCKVWSTPKPMDAAALVTTAIRSWKGGELMPLLHEGSVETLRDHKSTQQTLLPCECGTMSHPLPSCFPLRQDSAPARCFHT